MCDAFDSSAASDNCDSPPTGVAVSLVSTSEGSMDIASSVESRLLCNWRLELGDELESVSDDEPVGGEARLDCELFLDV